MISIIHELNHTLIYSGFCLIFLNIFTAIHKNFLLYIYFSRLENLRDLSLS
jgi:hypothetical protein